MAQVDLQTTHISGPQTLVPLKVDSTTSAIAPYDLLTRDGGYVELWASGGVHGIAMGAITTAPTADGNKDVLVEVGETALYDFPVITGTLTQAMEGKTCDGAVSSGRFGLNVSAATYNNFVIVRADVTNQRALVQLRPTRAGVV